MTTLTDTAAQAPYQEQPAAPVAESRGFSIASLVLGIVSIVASYTFVVPAVGLVLGIMALKREPATRTMAIWGIVLNSVMLAGALVVGLVAAVFGLVMLPFAFL